MQVCIVWMTIFMNFYILENDFLNEFENFGRMLFKHIYVF